MPTITEVCKRLGTGANGVRRTGIQPDILCPNKVSEAMYSDEAIAKIAKAMGLKDKGAQVPQAKITLK